MGRSKAREQYDSGGISAITIPRLDRDGNPVLGQDGAAVRVQKKDRHGRPMWKISVNLGTHTVVEGGRSRRKRVRIQRNFAGSLASARAFRDELAAQHEQVAPESLGMTFSDAIELWADSLTSSGLAVDTVGNYRREVRHMARCGLGDMELTCIGKTDIETALRVVKETRGVSSSTLAKVFKTTKRMLGWCVSSDWLMRNPADKVKAPKVGARPQRRSLTAPEMATLRARLDEQEERAYRAFAEKERRQAAWGNTFGRSQLRGLGELSNVMAVRTALFTGLRRSELLALTWAAVDFEGMSVSVFQKLRELRGKKLEVTDELKTANAYRTVPVDPSLIRHLERLRVFQKRQLNLLGVAQSGSTPVFVCDAGTWITPSNFAHWWGRFRDEVGFPGLLLHELRHSFASVLAANNFDLRSLSAVLGHASPAFTLSVYSHPLNQQSRVIADIIASAANGTPRGQVIGFNDDEKPESGANVSPNASAAI